MIKKTTLTEVFKKISTKRLFENRTFFLETDLLGIDNNILENDFLLIFTISEDDFNNKISKKLLEAKYWEPSGIKDYWYRTDPPRIENQFNKEICIAHKKNINSVPQWTWKSNLERKDNHKFTKEPTNSVKQIAARFFGVDVKLIEMRLIKYENDSLNILHEYHFAK